MSKSDAHSQYKDTEKSFVNVQQMNQGTETIMGFKYSFTTGAVATATLATEKRSQLPQVGSSESLLSQLRDIQKRLLEFIRKRVSLLEKALNAEYHKESIITEQKEFESINEEPEQEARDAHQPLAEIGSTAFSALSAFLLKVDPKFCLQIQKRCQHMLLIMIYLNAQCIFVCCRQY